MDSILTELLGIKLRVVRDKLLHQTLTVVFKIKKNNITKTLYFCGGFFIFI